MAAYSVCGWCIVLLMSCMVFCDNNNEVFGCLEIEKTVLLKLKGVINHQMKNSSSDSYRESWTWSDEEPDCCRWNWVSCDVFSKRIINLSITPNDLHNGWYMEAEWFLEASLFKPLEQLQNLTIRNVGLDFTGRLRLTKLQVLDLSFNAISHVPLLGELPSLKFLDLNRNLITHGFEELKNFSINLEYLNLNHFNDYIIGSGGKIPPSMWALTSLKILGLAGIGLNSSLPKGLCALKNLQELDLSDNYFEGVIPTCLSNLTSLRLLNLYGNELSGTIPSNVFPSLNSLEYVSLSYNYFDGLFSFRSFANNSKLEVFELQNLNPNLKADIQNAEWKHSIFQLKILKLSNCACRVIPSFLLSQYDLRYADLSYNGMTGELPSWLLANNSRLESLSLRDNFFTGRLTLQLDSYNAHLVYLDVSMNQVTGEIPTIIGSILPYLTYLNMSRNAIEGSIPSSIENMSELSSLDLSNNRLSGEIPEGLFSRCKELAYLKLSNNMLIGNFLPDNISKSSKLWYLSLGSNNLSGDLTHGRLETFTFGILRYFDISNNSIPGRFPDWISELPLLSILSMSKNNFEGKLPTSFCNLTELKFIDLSWNNFSDTLPLCTNLSSLQYLHLQGNKFHGQLPNSISRSSSIVTLDVSHNAFSGFIPAWISSLSRLVVLLLRGNDFHGSIPSDLCQLENLRILDLAANGLSGYVPICLSHVPFGKNKLLEDNIFDNMVDVYDMSFGSYSFENQLHISQQVTEQLANSYVQETVQLITKSMSESYKGVILNLMSSIDFSFNKLTGRIPLNIGNWDMVYSLNLSYNNFNGSIPWTISRLKALESLDLSHNMFTGEIPSRITELSFLSVFSVAYNNLSGPTPTMTRQFATFNSSSYEGNPLLYGCPLDKSCNNRSPSPQPAKPSAKREHNDFSYEATFLCSFFGSFIVSCIGAFCYFYFNTNVPERFLQWTGIERVPRWRNVGLSWN